MIDQQPEHRGDEQADDQADQRVQARGERIVIASFAVAIAGGVALTVVYSLGGQPQLEGIFLGLALGGIGVGAVAWAQRFMPSDEATEDRGELASTEDEVMAFTTAFEQGEENLQRRGLLVKLGLGALGALGLAALFPIRSLGPRAGAGLKQTAYQPGSRLVNAEGEPIRAADLVTGTVLTAWPEGDAGGADSSTLVIRTGVERMRLSQPTVEDLVAYSKLCTHTGCPVGLYQQEEQLLLCPCHQSTFDVLDGAEPVFGPAARPLPQLPIGLDEEGFLVALGDFPQPVGGGFWNRGR